MSWRRLSTGVGVMAAMVALLAFPVRDLFVEQALYKAREQRGIAKLNSLSTAQQYIPNSYPLLRELGWAEWRAGRPLNSRSALERAIASRPSWPYAWLKLAEWYAWQSDWSEDFERAVRQTYRLGKHSPTVMWRLAHLTLHTPQEQLRLDTARILDENLESALLKFNKKLLGRALLDDKVAVICKPRWLENNSALEIWCPAAEWLTTVCKPDILAPHYRDRCEGYYDHWRRHASRPIQ